jgi:hypothetical protein
MRRSHVAIHVVDVHLVYVSGKSTGRFGVMGGREGVCKRPNGGRTWWAHFEFTRINTTPTILRKKIEES